ncbi:MAG: hypothetical protein ACTS6H_02975 [Candidatus Hodgkinia cicadicola]
MSQSAKSTTLLAFSAVPTVQISFASKVPKLNTFPNFLQTSLPPLNNVRLTKF